MTKHTCRVLGCENPVVYQGAICDSCYHEYEDKPTEQEQGEREEHEPVRRMTRAERQQALADSGVDTWEDYRGER